MLPPDSRAILRDLLTPPIGSQFRQAVGTTFTIDFSAALSVPLSFAARDLGDNPDPIGVMEAVRSSAERIDIFYQAGKAAVPAPASDVLAFLEPVLHPVKAPRPGHLFHPKVWVLTYIDSDGAITYRLLCATRNLTNDRSWDAVISLDGRAGKRLETNSEPVSRFVGSLPGLCAYPLPSERRSRIETLAKELRRVVWELPEDASAVHFHALGIARGSNLPDFAGYRRLVVSPFVDPEGLAIVAPTTQRGTVLISRPEHLDRLDPIPADTDIRVLSVLAELEDERASGELSGLHAKMVILERNRLAHLFLGSANATCAAYGGNVEFLVEVIRGASKYGVDAHLARDTGFGALLEEYAPQPPTPDLDEEKRFQLQNLLRTLAELRWTATVQPASDTFDLHLSTEQSLHAAEARLTIELMTLRGEAIEVATEQPAEGVFRAVALADITPFLVLTAQWQGLTEATVIPARLVGDPEDRLDAVLARQVDSPEKFMRFLLVILGLLASGNGFGAGDGAGGGSWLSSGNAAVFELLARALADNPRSLDDLDRIVERLSRTEAGLSVMPEGFMTLWGTVLDAKQLLRAQE